METTPTPSNTSPKGLQSQPAPAAVPAIPAINLTLLASSCDNNAMIEALRVIGYGVDGKPLDGKSAHYETVTAHMPQLLDGSPAGMKGWSAPLDINHSGGVSNLEVAAALMAAAKLTVAQHKSLKDIAVSDIVAGMGEQMKKLTNEISAVCSISPSPSVKKPPALGGRN